MNPNAKPDYEQLIAYAAGELAGEAVGAVEQAARNDADAAATVSRFRAVADAVRTDRTEAPPAESLAAARALFRPVSSPSLLDRVRRVIAELVYDSRRQPALVGVRGAEQGYQLCFESEFADVDLQVEPVAGAATRRVTGQITPRGPARAATVVFSIGGEGAAVRTAAADDGGLFSVEMTAGSFELTITTADGVLVLPGVEVR